jgi:hypothetical protein
LPGDWTGRIVAEKEQGVLAHIRHPEQIPSAAREWEGMGWGLHELFSVVSFRLSS